MKYLYVLLFLSMTNNQTYSQLIKAFTPVISVTQKGDITFAANSITTCTSGGGCGAGQIEIPPAGTSINNNFNSAYIDNDGSTGIGAQTFSSSSSTLDMGGILGCGVIYAYLTWGGFVTTATTNYAKRDSIYFQVPGGAVYNKLKADLLVDNTAPYNRTYHCYKDVTALVKAAGPGSYTSGNIVARTGGTNQFAGWTLVVLYSDPNKALKNLTIFRGLAGVSGSSAVQFGISGFFTPPAPAPVNVKLGIVAYDGDRANPNAYNSGLPGDSLKFNGVAVNNGKNPASDIFNSTITNDNAEYTRTPAYTNTLGYDADLITLANGSYSYLGNSASSATLRMSSGGETILTDIVTTAIDVFEPEMRFEKSFSNISGNNPAQLGDIIEYTLKIFNKGSDPADSLIIIDSLYGALNYIPNSMSIVNGPLSGPPIGTKSDAIGDDAMDFFAAGNFIKARLGIGANGTKGGKLKNVAPDSVTTIRFRASITNDCTIFHCFDSVYNMAYATYYGQTSVQKRSTFSSANGIDPGTGCALTGPTSLKVIVPACPLPADTTLSNCTPYNLSLLVPFRPGYTTFYNSSWVQVTQATASGTYYAIKSIYPSSYYLTTCNDTVQIDFTSTGPCPLPIKLQQFEVNYTKPFIDIFWITAQEINNHHFVLERSIDGINFEKVVEIAGAINSNTPKSYYYTDKTFPKAGRIYYRLKQVDIDGKVTVSPVKTVLLSDYINSSFIIDNVMPNPAKEMTRIGILSAIDQTVQIRLIDLIGKEVKSGTFKMVKGSNIYSLDVSKIAAGIYILEIMDIGNSARVKERIMITK